MSDQIESVIVSRHGIFRIWGTEKAIRDFQEEIDRNERDRLRKWRERNVITRTKA